MRLSHIVIVLSAAVALSACDTGPNGYGTAPAGVSQSDWDAKVAADRDARHRYYSGPRGGHSGR